MSEESRAIALSGLANLLLAGLGIAFGIWTDSTAILLDGFFNVISLGMALLTLRVAKLVQRPPDDRFPFGYAAFEPMTNVVKSGVVLGVSGFALAGAVDAILEGGHPLAAGRAVLYAALAASGSGFLALVQRRAARATASPLVAVDAKNWIVNAAISAGVGGAFLGAMALQGTRFAGWVPYCDPVLVSVLVLVTAPLPLQVAWKSLAEIAGVAAPPETRAEVLEAVRSALSGDARAVEIGTMRMGRSLYVLARARLAPDRAITAPELDRLRERVRARLESLHPDLVFDLAIGTEPPGAPPGRSRPA